MGLDRRTISAANQGIARNCCFHTAAHRALIETPDVETYIPPSTQKAPGMNIVLSILTPLAGPEEFDLEVREFNLQGLFA